MSNVEKTLNRGTIIMIKGITPNKAASHILSKYSNNYTGTYIRTAGKSSSHLIYAEYFREREEIVLSCKTDNYQTKVICQPAFAPIAKKLSRLIKTIEESTKE